LSEEERKFARVPGYYNLLGVIEARDGNYLAAETNFRQALQIAPDFSDAYLNLGHLYQDNVAKDRQALQKALETYRRLLRADPSHIEANYQAAVLLEHQGSFKASLAHLSRLPPAAQEWAQVLALRLADLGGLGEKAQVDEAAKHLLASPDLTETDVLSVLPRLKSGSQNDLRVRLLEGLAARNLGSASSLRQLAQLYEQQKRWDQARSTLEKISQTEANLVPVLLDLAYVAHEQGDRKGALGYLAHARDLDPQNAAVHYFFGMVCVEEKLAQEAYTSLKEALSLNGENPYYNYAFGAVALGRDDPREAIPAFQKYCELKPQDPRGRLSLGVTYFFSRDYDKAKKELVSIIGFKETAAGAHYYLGRMANQEGDFARAGRELQLALEASPKYPDAFAEVGVLHMKQREYKLAERAFRRALELDPDNYNANFNLMVMYQRTKDDRAAAQTQRFEEIKKRRAERQLEMLRTVEVRP
jgi:tetratricopeptide (TPR) repeat protein